MKLRAIVFTGVFGISCGSTWAADFFISPTGSNDNPGTLEKPWKTFAFAVTKLAAGDQLSLRGGTYGERLILTEKRGTAEKPITIQRYKDEVAVIDGSKLVVPAGNRAGLVALRGCEHIHLQGLDVRNFVTDSASKLPVGIQIEGQGAGIWVTRCKVHHIWQSNTGTNGNGFGIAVYGTGSTPIDKLVLDGNEVYDLRTGSSESIVLNGNVTNFSVVRNTVHDCNNIGIDFIGYEGTQSNADLDRARNGVCADNFVYNIDSKFNPSYGGNFGSGGNNDTRSAPGIYVDGGSNIVIERNHVRTCNFAISVGSEHKNRLSTNVTVRDNVLHHCHVGGIVTGGSDTTNGGAKNCTFTNNTLYDNDTVGYGGGQFMIQHYVTGSTVRRNIMASTADFVQVVLKDNSDGSFAANAIDFNLYQLRGDASIEFIWGGSSKSTFDAWKSAGSLAKDAHSKLIRTSVGFAASSPSASSPASDFDLLATSPAKDTGDSAAAPYAPPAGEKDFDGGLRKVGERVDIGAFEYNPKL